MTQPEQYRKLHDAEEVTQRIGAIATEIILQYQNKNPLFVGLLRGAAPFSSMLMFEIAKQAPDMHPELDYMMVSTYGESHHAGEPRIVTDLAPTTSVWGREVVVIDDVLDLGRTADFVKKHLERLGAMSVQLAVLAKKQAVRETDIDADYVGFETGDAWLVGMGMDNAHEGHEARRWLNEIWEIKKDEPQHQHAVILDPEPEDSPANVP
jgi:hypoxanthine phosphoribosyltransferase